MNEPVPHRGQKGGRRRGSQVGPPPRRQRGVALLTAMIIVTLVATLAGSMVWQQWRSIQVEEAERARVQSGLILTGALDWARLILTEDLRSQGNAAPVDHLNEPWAVPLAEARLSTFLAADRDNTDGGPEAFLSGTITDLQSRYNLRRLYASTKPEDTAKELAILNTLFGMIGVSQDVAARINTGLQAANFSTAGSGGSRRLLMPESVQELSWFGIDAETIRRIQPYILVLPQVVAEATKVNVNTASREVIAAVLGIDLAGAERLVQQRQLTPFRTLDEVGKALPGGTMPASANDSVSLNSSYFEVRGRLRLGDRILEERSVVQRNSAGVGRTRNSVTPLRRDRISSRDEGTP